MKNATEIYKAPLSRICELEANAGLCNTSAQGGQGMGLGVITETDWSSAGTWGNN